jgi:hypothetical protein
MIMAALRIGEGFEVARRSQRLGDTKPDLLVLDEGGVPIAVG